MTGAIIGLGGTLFMAIVGFAYWCGKISQKTNSQATFFTTMNSIDRKVDNIDRRLSKVEGVLEMMVKDKGKPGGT